MSLQFSSWNGLCTVLLQQRPQLYSWNSMQLIFLTHMLIERSKFTFVELDWVFDYYSRIWLHVYLQHFVTVICALKKVYVVAWILFQTNEHQVPPGMIFQLDTKLFQEIDGSQMLTGLIPRLSGNEARPSKWILVRQEVGQWVRVY